jgi:hypothetical protein
MGIKFNASFDGKSGTRSGCAGRTAAAIFFLVFLVVGIIVGVILFRQVSREMASRSWEATPCTILSANIEPEDSNYPLRVKYVYQYVGKPYASTQVAAGYTGTSDYSDAQRLLHKYTAIGDGVEQDPSKPQTTCFVNPENPAEAVLDTISSTEPSLFAIPIIFGGIGAAGLVYLWRSRVPENATVSITQQSKSGRRIARAMLTGMFLLFLIFGIVFLFNMIDPVLQMRHSASWIETPCTILTSEIRSHRGDKSTTYSVEIVYAYEFEGRQYRSNRFKFMRVSSSGLQGKQALVAQHPPGSQTQCYVDPVDPYNSVIIREFSPEMLIGLIPVVFMLIGVIGLIVMSRGAMKSDQPDSPAAALKAMKASANLPMGAVTLEPTQSARSKLIFMAIFGVLWNGIVAVFVIMTIRDWQKDQSDVCSTLFLIPFVVIGLVVIGVMIHTLLATFNPRARVTLSNGAPRLGETVKLSWEMIGSAHRIQRLRVRIEAREQATYRRGTRTYTDRHVFYVQSPVDTTRPIDVVRGQATIQIPRDTMHSWSTSSNSIVWELIVHGEIARWPDVKETYTLDVRPLNPSEIKEHESDRDPVEWTCDLVSPRRSRARHRLVEPGRRCGCH